MFHVVIDNRETPKAILETFEEAREFMIDYFSWGTQGIMPVITGSEAVREYNVICDDKLYNVKIRKV